MTSSDRKIVRIGKETETKILSKAQKQFNNLIKKIDAEKQLLLQWQETIPEYQRKIADEYEPLWDAYNAQRAEIVHLLDRAYENKLFKNTDKKKIRHLITEITADLIGGHGKEELKDLHNKYSDSDFDADRQEADAMAGELMKSMLQDMFGMDLGDDVDFSSPEKIQAAMQEKLQEMQDRDAEKQRQAEERRAKRKKTAKQLEREARQQQEEQSISQSIREVYRKLTTALHPDREQDATERERKTEIMQRVNAAYAKKDLLGLLGLQLEAEQIDEEHLNNIAEERLKYFNKILKEQLEELQQEIAQLEHSFRLRLDMPPYMALPPERLLQRLERDIRGIKQDISQLRKDFQAFQDPAVLKAWLKDYKIPKKSERDGLDELFFGGFEPPFGFK